MLSNDFIILYYYLKPLLFKTVTIYRQRFTSLEYTIKYLDKMKFLQEMYVWFSISKFWYL